MASLRNVFKNRYAIFFWATMECLLFSAIIYGWASLVHILKKEKFFRDSCADNFNVTNENQQCIAQDELLNLAFTVGVFSFTSFGIVAGALLDHAGPRVTRLAACVCFACTGVIFTFTNNDCSMLLFPAVIGLTLSGILLFVTMLQLPVLFRKRSSFAASFLNGGLDSSSIVPLFFKFIYYDGVPLRSIFVGYFVFAVLSVGVFTFCLPPEPIEREDVEYIAKELQEDVDEEDMMSEVTDEEWDGSQESLQELFQMTDPVKQHIHEKNVIRGSLREFCNIATSPMYILHVAFLSIHKLRLWFYMGSMHQFLQFTSEHDTDSVNTYLNWFGIIQFTGMLFSPIAGLIMDWRPQAKQNATFGFIVAFCITNSLNFLLNIIVVIPVLELQVLSFVVQVGLRGFLYSTYAAFILHRFPLEHCGKLYGLGHFIGAIIGALQFYLFVIVHSRLEGNPFWVNVGFLVVTLIIYVHPFYIWIVTEKEIETRKPRQSKYTVEGSQKR